MAPSPIFLATLLLLATVDARKSTHTTRSAATLPIYPAFVHLPTPPAVLDATLLSAAPAPTGTGTAVLHWSIDCPSAKNRDNNDCRDLSVFPAELWHTQNGAWGGKMESAGATTMWSCDLSSGGSATKGPQCVDTITSKGQKKITTTALGCHGDRQLVPLRISEGADKFPEGWEGVLMGELNKQYGGGLEADTACAATWTMQSGAPSVTRNVTTTATGTTTSGGVGETGLKATKTSDGSAVASETGEGSGVSRGVSGGLLVVGAAAAVLLGV